MSVTVGRMCRNILEAWVSTPLSTQVAGVLWYPKAHHAAMHVNSDIRISAGVIAVLSPGLSWSQNLQSALELCLGRDPNRVAGYDPNKRKALRILAGEPAESVLSGPKVTAFYRLICHGGNAIDVCIDGHAANIALGRSKLRISDSYFKGSDQPRIAQAYRDAAIEINRRGYAGGVRPCDVQAATWLSWRASNGFTQGLLELS